MTTDDKGMFSLEGQVALVTGASRGLGLAMAEGLAENGATVVLNGRYSETLEAASRTLQNRGLKAEALPFDVTDLGAAGAAVDAIVARHGSLNILIANAGIIRRSKLADWTSDDWDEVLAANLKASFFLAQKAAEPMRRQGHGRLIFTTSINGIVGRSNIHGYVASKSALAGIARSLAAELGEFGITCNSIAPGYFETEFTTALMQDEAFVARINARVPLRRWGVPRELSGVAAFLASKAASYITGQQIVVDGGFTTTM